MKFTSFVLFLVPLIFFGSVSGARSKPKIKFIQSDRVPNPILERFEKLKREAQDMEKDIEGMDPSRKGLTMSIARLDLNSDELEDLCVSFNSYSLYGNAGASITCYVAKNKDTLQEVVSVDAVAPESVSAPGSRTKGYLDLTFGSPGIPTPHIWKWDGLKYQ